MKNKGFTDRFKNKGFTLAEILGVIVIIGLLLLLIAPMLITKIREKSIDAEQTGNAFVYNASEQLIHENEQKYPKGKSYCIKVEDLVKEGKLTSPVLNIKTGENIEEKNVFVTIKSTGEMTFELMTKEECEEAINLPSIEIFETENSEHEKIVTIKYPSVNNEAFPLTGSDYTYILPAENKKNYDITNGLTTPNLTLQKSGVVIAEMKYGDKIIHADKEIKVKQYKVYLDGNGSTSGDTENIKCYYGGNCKLPENKYIKEGYTFAGWNTKPDGTGTTYEDKQTVKNLKADENWNVKLYAMWTDNTKPEIDDIEGGTLLKSSRQELTLKCTDKSGVVGYYFGKTNPENSEMITLNTEKDLTDLQEEGLKKSINEEGTYYLACKDKTGNYDVKSITIRKYQVQNVLEKINGTTGTYNSSNYEILNNSKKTYIVKEGTKLTLDDIYETPQEASSQTFKGFTTSEPSLSDTPSVANPTALANDATTYYMWFDRNTYKITINKPSNGKVKAETETQLGNSVTASSAQAQLTVKYGDKVKATASANGGYHLSSWSGYVTGTSNPTVGDIITSSKTIGATFIANTYTTSYTLNGGTLGTNKPSTGTYDTDVQISNPTKTVTVSADANGTGANIGSSTSKQQIFKGWTSTTLGNNATSGTSSNPSTKWTGNLTKNTYFRNLRETGTVTMVANWTPVEVKLPELSKEGYTCKWYTEKTGGTEMGTGGENWTPSENSPASVTAYARCTYNATPIITREDYNTFTVSAPGGSEYLISKSQTSMPSSSTSGWNDNNIQDTSTSEKETWYVWVKDENGNVSAQSASITNYKVTLTQGQGTTLTAKADDISNGANITSGMYILNNTPIFPLGTLKEGYHTLILKKGTTQIANSSSQTISSDTTFTSSATSTSAPAITVTDHNTFTYNASNVDAYYITASSTKPSAGTNISSAFALNTWTKATSTGNLTLESGQTYYVWTEKEGVVSSSSASIAVKAVTRQEGEGTTLTTKYDSSSGDAFTEEAVYVLNGSKINVTGSLKTGYHTLVLKNGNNIITAGDQTISANASFTSSATSTSAPAITVTDHNTFTYNASNVDAYYITASSTKPSAGTNISSAFALNTWTKATSTGNLTLESGQTYYVWTEKEGVVSSSSASIAVKAVTRQEGEGTTLTTKYDSSSGDAFTEEAVYVLNGSKINVTGSLKTGYHTLVLKNGNNIITAGDQTISANASFKSSSEVSTYEINYTLNNGILSQNCSEGANPTSGTYNIDVRICNPTKTITVTGNANNTGATVGAATSKSQTFSGWTSTTLGSNAKTGSSATPTTSWTGTSTKNTYFRNLRESGTVTMIANWETPSVTLPSISKTGHICKWYTEASGGTEIGESGDTWTSSTITGTSVTVYARCTEDHIQITNVAWTSTTHSITAVVTATSDSGVAKYEYSIDNGTTWEEDTDETHTINDLDYNTGYPLVVRATSNTGLTDTYTVYTETENQTTNDLLFWGEYDNPNNTNTTFKNKVNGTDGTLYNFENDSSSGYTEDGIIFDGDDDYIDIGLSNYNFNNSQTMLLYFKLSNVNSFSNIFGNWEGSGSGITYTSDKKLGYEVHDGSSFIYAKTDEQKIYDDRYYCAVGTYDGTNAKFYLDGNLIATSPASALTSSTQPILLGANPNVNGSRTSNAAITLKEAMLFNRALSSEEVANLTYSLGVKYENKYDVRTLNIEIPTFEESIVSAGKDVTITYDSKCANGQLTCYYALSNTEDDEGTRTQINSATQTLTFAENKYITAIETDGINTVSSTYTLTLDNDLFVSSTGNDTTGRGTIENPYKTIARAYEAASDTKPSTIYVMNNITEPAAVTMDDEKEITITSSNTSGQTGDSIINTVTKASGITTGYWINETTGYLTLKNIVFSGNNVSSDSSMILLGGEDTYMNLQTGSTLKNGVSTTANGGAIHMSNTGAILEINGGTVTANKAPAGGGIFAPALSTFTLNSGTISSNQATTTYGGGLYLNGQSTINGGTISGNTAIERGGGIYYASNSDAVINNGTITSNQATTGVGFGGGIQVVGQLTINNASITNNTARTYGGGMFIETNSETVLNGGSITNNTATNNYGGGIRNNGTITITGGNLNSNSSNEAKFNNYSFHADGILNDTKADYIHDSDSYYVSTKLSNTYVLDVKDGSTANGTNVQLYTNSSADKQKWQFLPALINNGVVSYRFESKINNAIWLDTTSQGATSGTNVLVASTMRTSSQRWILSSAGSPYYYIKIEKDSTKCLDVTGGAVANGKNIQLYSCASSDRMKWKFNSTSTANKYTIKFNANGGTGTMSNKTCTIGSACPLTANSYTRADHKFMGWNTKADGTGTNYADKASVTNLTTTPGTTVNLYATWRNNKKLYVSSSGNDTTGYGTIANPYKTIAKAYTEAASTANIYVMSNLTQTAKVTMGSSKTITISSCTANSAKTSCTYSSVYSVTRGSTYTNGPLIDITTGSLTTTQITISGNNIGSTRSLIIDRSTLNINTGTTITKGKNSNNNDHDFYSGCIMVYGGKMTMNAGTISSCSTNGMGGAISVKNTSSATATASIKGGTITGNTANEGAGIFVAVSSKLTISGGTISNNTASYIGGGVWCNGICSMSAGTISGNKATTQWGGGVYIYMDGKFTQSGGVVKKNTAYVGGGGIVINTNTASNATYKRTGGYVCKNNTPNNRFDITETSNSNCS